MNRLARHSWLFVGILLMAFPFAASAQSLGADPLTLTPSSQYPHPYERITIQPSSSLLNLSASTLTYTVDGKPGGKGSAGNPFSVQAGAAGTATTISVTVTGPDGTTKKTLVLRPTDVELVAEPQTSTHPLYPGAALVASEGMVRLVAIADLRTGSGRIDPASLVYDWKLGDQQLVAQSGIGQSVLMVAAPMRYRDATVSVTVSNQADTVAGHASYTLSPVEPVIRIYENNPLLGPRFDHALSGTFSMNDTEASFVATPYFFSGAPAISWSIGGVSSSKGPVITVKSAGSGTGNTTIEAVATGASALERAASAVAVSFKGTAAATGFGSLFGL